MLQVSDDPENLLMCTIHKCVGIFVPRELVARSATFWKASRKVATATTVALGQKRKAHVSLKKTKKQTHINNKHVTVSA